MYIPLLQSLPYADISTGFIIFALCFALCLHQWKTIKAYSHFPSKRLDLEWLFRIIMGRYPKDIPFTSFCFQTLLKAVNEFPEEGICVMWFFKPYVFVYREKYMKYLVNEIELADKSFPYEINKDVFGNGLIGSTHEVWKVHRKLMQPAFSLGVLKNQMPSLNKHALLLAKKLQTAGDKPVDNVMEILKYYAFQTMADFVLGMKLDDERHEALVETIMKLTDKLTEHCISKLTSPCLYWKFLLPLIPEGRKYLKDLDESNQLVKEVLIKEMIAERQNLNTEVIDTCGNMIIDLHLKKCKFTEQDVRDHLVTFIAAGYDTVAITMFWCFYTLGHYPEVQDRVYSEIQSEVPEGIVTYEDLSKLKYLECVIKETLRMYPTIPLTGRKASKDVQCGQYTLTKGTEVCFFIFELHRDPNIFPQPEKFYPDRFSDNSKLRPWMFTPFSEGYRNCIGKKFAIMELKVQLVHVLRRFRITSLDKIDESDLDWAIIMKPTKCVRFSFEKRHSKS